MVLTRAQAVFSLFVGLDAGRWIQEGIVSISIGLSPQANSNGDVSGHVSS